MKTLDELKQNWATAGATQEQAVSEQSLQRVYKKHVNKQIQSSMQYFWASLALQILVYSLLAHMMVKNYSDLTIVGYGFAGVILYIPFTIVLLKKFKSIAKEKISNDATESLYNYSAHHYEQLYSFYIFKKRYELILIPLSVAIGVILTFNLYLPGGVVDHVNGAIIVYLISLASCIYAIIRENKRSFDEPLSRLRKILDEFKEVVK